MRRLRRSHWEALGEQRAQVGTWGRDSGNDLEERDEGSRHRGKGTSVGDRTAPPEACVLQGRRVGGRATGDKTEGLAPTTVNGS